VGEVPPDARPPDAASTTDAAAWERTALDPRTATFPARAKVADEGIVIFRNGGGYFGVQRACPHQGGSMLDAVLQGNGTLLRCPRHNYVFRTANGNPVNCPGFRLQIFEVKEEDGGLFVRRPPAA
jgi:nitrite reductase/ring-hydroxylating ferredoxin subunit